MICRGACKLFWVPFLRILRAAGAPVRRRPRCGGGPRGTQKLIKFFFCSSEPFTKIFLKRQPRENLTKTLRKSHENAWIPIENACFLSKTRSNKVFAEKKVSEEIFKYYLNHARDYTKGRRTICPPYDPIILIVNQSVKKVCPKTLRQTM